jgi:hypothetical protein
MVPIVLVLRQVSNDKLTAAYWVRAASAPRPHGARHATPDLLPRPRAPAGQRGHGGLGGSRLRAVQRAIPAARHGRDAPAAEEAARRGQPGACAPTTLLRHSPISAWAHTPARNAPRRKLGTAPCPFTGPSSTARTTTCRSRADCCAVHVRKLFVARARFLCAVCQCARQKCRHSGVEWLAVDIAIARTPWQLVSLLRAAGIQEART